MVEASCDDPNLMAMHNMLPANCCSKEKMSKCWETLTCIYHLYMTYVSRGWTFTIFFLPLQTTCDEFFCILILYYSFTFFSFFLFPHWKKNMWKALLFPFFSGVWTVMWYHGIELYFFMVRTTVMCACIVDWPSIKLLWPFKTWSCVLKASSGLLFTMQQVHYIHRGRKHHFIVVTERDPDLDSKSVMHKSDININSTEVCIASDRGNIIKENSSRINTFKGSSITFF